MKQRGSLCSRLEYTLGFVVLFILLTIAGGIFLKQFSFNPAVLISREIASPQKGAELATIPLPWLPSELKDFGPAENFTPDNLYDKIDGKAELYLASGIVGMRCQRFALKADTDQWLEWFVYDMGTLPQAFSVFSTQRRAEGENLDLTDYAYRTQNAVYFIAGSNYVEAVASSSNEALMNATLDMARRFVAASPKSSERNFSTGKPRCRQPDFGERGCVWFRRVQKRFHGPLSCWKCRSDGFRHFLSQRERGGQAGR
jgi:hypothetical protein